MFRVGGLIVPGVKTSFSFLSFRVLADCCAIKRFGPGFNRTCWREACFRRVRAHRVTMIRARRDGGMSGECVVQFSGGRSEGQAVGAQRAGLGQMTTAEEPTLEYTLDHVRDYLEGRIDIQAFWAPFPAILAFYHDYPEDPAHRLSYFWRHNSGNVRSIVEWGNADAEPGYREYLRLWLDALQKPEEEWREIVRRKGWALEDIDPDWDK